MKSKSRHLHYAIQYVLDRMVKEGTVERHRLSEDERPKGKRGQAPYVYSLTKRKS